LNHALKTLDQTDGAKWKHHRSRRRLTRGFPTVTRLAGLHQKAAIGDVIKGIAGADRGKLIMACGTGKTFTALKIAEQLAAFLPRSYCLKRWSSR
jgi:predicted helicase